MNRRSFLGKLVGLAAAVVAAPAVVEALQPVDTCVTITDQKNVAFEWESFERGDVFTIAGVNATHPITGKELPMPRQFVVTENIRGGEAVPSGEWVIDR